MSQGADGIDLPTSLGYLLKEAASALRAAMEEALRPLGMTITHYSCLELLAQRPGSSNSDLARGAFVTRQSMNVLLQTLERDGIVTRPAEEAVGRVAAHTPHAHGPPAAGEGQRGRAGGRAADARRPQRRRPGGGHADPARHGAVAGRGRRVTR